MFKSTTIESYFKSTRKNPPLDTEVASSSQPSIEISSQDCPPPIPTPTPTPTPTRAPAPKQRRLEIKVIDVNSLERDPGLRLQIHEYSVDQRDEIRHAYIQFGSYQPVLSTYPSSGKHPRRFQPSWFTLFPWLEYSPSKDALFCHPCFVFNKPTDRSKSSAFIIEGFRNWKKVNDGKNCALLNHTGKGPNSTHNMAVRACQDLMRQSQHIENVFHKQTSEQIVKNRLRLKTSIDVVRWLTFQACAFRGNDEGPDSKNCGNFIELIKLLASYSEKVAEVVLGNAPGNAKYTSPPIQKEILHIIARKTRNIIREEIGDAKFCILVDEARDDSKREQMALVLRFVDIKGVLRERFFDIIHISDTKSMTLKNEISKVLSHNNLSIQDIRGQGYDGASNMRGEWNGLQALFRSECPYAYYVHCFAHRLQLTLVAASKRVTPVYEFFNKLTFIVNTASASSKRHDELQDAQLHNIEDALASGQLESGRGLNQIGTLQRAGDTRWSSHYASVCSLMKMYDATCTVLSTIIKDGSTHTQRGDASSALDSITSFEFVFILHLLKEIMGITDDLCQALQSQTQDILSAVALVRSTKLLLRKLREEGWDALLEKVISFCNQYEFEVPGMSGLYVTKGGRFRPKKHQTTVEHYYRFDIFNEMIDSQWQEINARFNEHTLELFVLSSALDPKDGYKFFNIDSICSLVDKFYPQDFSNQDKIHLRYQLQHYSLDVSENVEQWKFDTISELCQGLVKMDKSRIYPLVDRLLRLVLTLPVSTATTERAFSAMKLVKSRLRTKMEDDYLADSMIVYIEKEIAEKITVESIIEDFSKMKGRKVQF